MIRSNADPAVDMFNVDNPVTLVGYLSRDQYGDWPIVYGPDFTDRPGRTEGSDQYIKGKDKYESSRKISRTGLEQYSFLPFLSTNVGQWK